MHYTVKQRLKQDYEEIKDHYEDIISADRLLHYIRVIIGVENKNCKNIKAWMVSNSPGDLHRWYLSPELFGLKVA